MSQTPGWKPSAPPPLYSVFDRSIGTLHENLSEISYVSRTLSPEVMLVFDSGGGGTSFNPLKVW